MTIHLPCNPRTPFRLPFWTKRSWSRNLDHDDLVFFETKDPYWEDQSPFDLPNILSSNNQTYYLTQNPNTYVQIIRQTAVKMTHLFINRKHSLSIKLVLLSTYSFTTYSPSPSSTSPSSPSPSSPSPSSPSPSSPYPLHPLRDLPPVHLIAQTNERLPTI